MLHLHRTLVFTVDGQDVIATAETIMMCGL